MKTVLLALAMGTATLFVTPAAIAAPGSGDNIFVEAKLGSATVSDWDGGTQASSPELLTGYRWNTGFGKLGFELGYLDFGEIASGTPSNSFAFYGASFKGHAIKAGVDLNYTLAEGLYVEPRIGLMSLSYTGVQRDFDPNTNDINYTYYDETKIGHYVGVGLGFWITPNFAVSLNFDGDTAEILGHTETINVFSIGVQYQF